MALDFGLLTVPIAKCIKKYDLIDWDCNLLLWKSNFVQKSQRISYLLFPILSDTEPIDCSKYDEHDDTKNLESERIWVSHDARYSEGNGDLYESWYLRLHREERRATPLVADTIHEGISVDLIASPEPPDHEWEQYTENPGIIERTCSCIVEREEKYFRDKERREGDIFFYESYISPDEPPDETRSTHHESDIGEGVSERNEIWWAKCIVREKKSPNHSSKECIWEKSARMCLSYKGNNTFIFSFLRLLVDFIEWEDNDESNNVEDQSYEKWYANIDTREKWKSNNEKDRDECNISWYSRGDFPVFHSSSEEFESPLQEYICNTRIECIIAERHADRSEYEAPESSGKKKKYRGEHEKYLRDDECIFLTISIGYHPCRHLHEHTCDVSTTRIETDLICLCMWQCEKIHRKNRNELPPTREIDEKVFPEIGLDSGEFHYWITGMILSSATADIEFFGEPSMSLSE